MIEWLNQLSADVMVLIEVTHPLIAYSVLAFASFFENVFPPAPGDVITVFGASLVATGHLSFLGVFVSTTIGSVAGFYLFFLIGRRMGRHYFLERDIKFLPKEAFFKVESWFEKHGYNIVVANRFLSGVRSVISIFCGVTQLRTGKTLLYATISAVVWNLLLISTGIILGENWETIKVFLSQYMQVVISLIILATITVLIGRYVKRRRLAQSNSSLP